MPTVFISYRRADTAATAVHLRALLEARLLPDSVFLDQHALQPGAEFPSRLAQAVDAAELCVVLIGRGWLAALAARVAAQANDFVRQEVGRALARGAGCAVLPVLVDGADMPSALQLVASGCDELSGLGGLTAFPLHAHGPREYEAVCQQIAMLVPHRTALPRLPADARRVRNRPPGSINRLVTPHFHDPARHLDALARALRTESLQGRPAQVVLCGPAGAGKTQLVLKFAQQCDADYAGIWWFSCRDGNLPAQAAAGCSTLGIASAAPTDALDGLGRWLGAQALPWLLIIEDALPADRDALDRMLPTQGPHHAIVTTCASAWPHAALHRVEPWSPAASADYLQRRIDSVDGTAASELGQALSGLPLALDHAARHLEQQRTSAQDYLQQLQDRDGAHALLAQPFADRAGRTRSVFDTVQSSCAALSPAAVLLLRVCAVCDADWLPERCLRSGFQQEVPVLAPHAATDYRWAALRNELLRAHLASSLQDVLQDADGSQVFDDVEPLLRVHRLVRRVVQLQMHMQTSPQWLPDGSLQPKPEPAVAEVGAMARVLHHAATAELQRTPVHWPRARLLARHAQALGFDASALDAAGLCALAGDIFDAAEDAHAAYPCRQRWLEHCEALLPDRLHPIRLSAGADYAQACLRVRQSAAAEVWARNALALATEAIGAGGDAVACGAVLRHAHATLTKALLQQGRGADALGQAIGRADAARTGGWAPPEALDALVDLAEALVAVGRLRAAHDVQRNVLAIARQQGDDSEAALIAKHNLAATCHLLGDWPAAQVLQAEVLESRRSARPASPRKRGMAALHLAESILAAAAAAEPPAPHGPAAVQLPGLIGEAVEQLAQSVTQDDPLLLRARAAQRAASPYSIPREPPHVH